jgi:hypothetical protein
LAEHFDGPHPVLLVLEPGSIADGEWEEIVSRGREIRLEVSGVENRIESILTDEVAGIPAQLAL